MSVSSVLELLSGIALFLFGMSLMGDGLKKVAGNKLEIFLYKLSNTPLKGIVLGSGVTAVIQSSSATSVMVVGFVNSGMMKVRQAMSIIMGAIIGTSITGWIICLSSVGGAANGTVWEILSTDTFTAVLAVVGILLRMFSKKAIRNRIGDIMLGFSVLMFGIDFMSSAVYPLRESEVFIGFLTKSMNPAVGILIGLAFTCIIQSASAAVGILQALAVTGAINFEMAFPIIMGIAIGAAVPVLLSALGANANGKRTAFTYLFVDVFGVIICSVVFYTLNAFIDFGFMHTTMSMVNIAMLNTCFRIIIVFILAPFTGLLEKFVNLFVKDKEDLDEVDIDRLEDRFLVNPTMAIEQSRLTIQAMAKHTYENFKDAISLVDSYSDEVFERVGELENTIDKYEDKLGNYLIKIMATQLDRNENRVVSEYLHTITDLERISDHAKNISESFQEKYEKKIRFSDEGFREIELLIKAVDEILSLAITSFVENDLETAQKVEPLEQTIDDLCDEMKSHHIDRITDGICSYDHGFVFNDLLTDLERISDHCSNVALAVIESEQDINTHEYAKSIKSAFNSDYEKMFSEYSEKYRI